MRIIPRRNLPTPSEPWGRSVDSRLADIENLATRQTESTDNALSAINATLTGLGNQVTEIKTLTDTLAAQQGELSKQQASLLTQQEQLSSALTQLTDVVNSQISAQTRTASEYASYSGAIQDFGVVEFSFPAGYTKAYVMCVSSASFDTSAGTNAAVYTRIGPYSSGQQAGQSGSGDVISITSSFASLLEFDGSGPFSCSTRAQDISGVLSQGWVQTSATVLFLR